VDGTIQLESRAQALEDGRAGQSIQVRLVSSTDAILAKVTPNGQLELLP
jgi:flagella basal body P-ring formation protein FlgA